MQEASSAANRPLKAKAPDYSFRIWLAAAVSMVLIGVVLATAWAVNQAIAQSPRLSKSQARVIIAVAQFPGLIRESIQELLLHIDDDPLPLLMDKTTTEKPHWVRNFPAADDSGYLLFSGVDPAAKHSNVQLIRIADGAIIARWDPDWPAVLAQHTPKKYSPQFSPKTIEALHPLLLADGDVIFNTKGQSLVRLSPCSSKPVWVLDDVMHHSIEIDDNGTLWIPSVSQDGFTDNTWLNERIRDDALARVTTDGKVIEKRSFVRILRSNGLQALLLGAAGERLNDDPIHINQIKIAPRGSEHWQQGDLLISARSLSTVFLYRPSTNKIIWHRTGPWLNQHSADFVDNHRISIFDNNAILFAPKGQEFVTRGDKPV